MNLYIILTAIIIVVMVPLIFLEVKRKFAQYRQELDDSVLIYMRFLEKEGITEITANKFYELIREHYSENGYSRETIFMSIYRLMKDNRARYGDNPKILMQFDLTKK